MEDFIQMSYLYDVFLRSTAKLQATSRQPEVTYTSFAKLTLLRYSSGLEPGDSSPVYIRPCGNQLDPSNEASPEIYNCISLIWKIVSGMPSFIQIQEKWYANC